MATNPIWTDTDTVKAHLPDVSSTSVVNTLIPQAIIESENKIATQLKEGYTISSSDQGLITGATSLSAAATCRGMAAQVLLGNAPWGAQTAKVWLELAAIHERNAAVSLRPFTNAPMLTAGQKQGNASWSE